MLKNLLILLSICTFLGAFSSCTSTHHNNPLAASENLKLGLAYLQAGSRVDAKNKLLLAIQQDPNNSLVYGAYGYFLEKCGEIQAAEKYYLQAIYLANNNEKGTSYNNYGTYLYRQKRYKEAINYFLKAIREPNYLNTAAAYENAGLAALGANNKKLAKIYFQKALANDPNIRST